MKDQHDDMEFYIAVLIEQASAKHAEESKKQDKRFIITLVVSILTLIVSIIGLIVGLTN